MADTREGYGDDNGDFNVRVGNNVETWGAGLCKYGPAEQNENGVRW